MKNITYYLFGADACKVYHYLNFPECLKALKEEFGYGIYMHDENKHHSSHLLIEYSGWEEWAELTEDEYNQISNL